jgi:hypothetical protein
MPEFEPERIPEETRGAIERANINVEDAHKAIEQSITEDQRQNAEQELKQAQVETERVSTEIIEQSGISEQGQEVINNVNIIQNNLVTGTPIEFILKVLLDSDPNIQSLNDAMNKITKDIGKFSKNFEIDVEEDEKRPEIKEFKELREKYKSLEDLNKDLNDTTKDLKEEVTELNEKVGKLMEENASKVEEQGKKSGLKDKIKEKLGEKGWSILKFLIGLGALAGIGIGIASLIAKALTGCYQYIKPNPGQKLSSGCSKLFDNDDQQKYCSCLMADGTSDGQNSCRKDGKYVYCNPVPCANNPQYCTKTRSEDNAVWYAYAQYSIWDIFSNIVNFVVQKIENILGDASDFLSTLLKYGKWALIIVGIIFLLGLVFSLLKRIWPSSSNNSEKIVYIQNPLINQTSNIPIKTSFKFY